MAQAGAHAIIGMYASRLSFLKRINASAIIIGSLIPDLDIILVAFGKLFTNIPDPIHFFHRKGTHSFLFVLFIYLLFEIFSEILKKTELRNWGKGISIGITTHLIVDSFLFLNGVYLLWPIQLQFNFWEGYQPPEILPNLLLAMEFLFFRILAWIIIEISTQRSHVNFPGLLPLIVKWKNFELKLFLSFIILSFIKIPFYDILFGIFYLPSLIVGIIVVWFMRDIFIHEEIRGKF